MNYSVCGASGVALSSLRRCASAALQVKCEYVIMCLMSMVMYLFMPFSDLWMPSLVRRADIESK